MPNVDPIPAGCEGIIAHLVVDGAAKALEFYKKAFGAEEVIRMPTPDGTKLLHAELKIGKNLMYLADEFPEFGSQFGISFFPISLSLFFRSSSNLFFISYFFPVLIPCSK